MVTLLVCAMADFDTDEEARAALAVTEGWAELGPGMKWTADFVETWDGEPELFESARRAFQRART